MNRLTLSLLLLVITMTLTSCSVIRTTFSVIKTTYKTIKGTVKGTVWVVRGTYQLTKETTRLVYHIGMFTFEVVRAPLTVASAQTYAETGLASWYGEETRRQPGGYMTANGELFNPNALTAAHKHLSLPTHV